MRGRTAELPAARPGSGGVRRGAGGGVPLSGATPTPLMDDKAKFNRAANVLDEGNELSNKMGTSRMKQSGDKTWQRHAKS